eukprot:Hpha_TRINITY_DN15020_c7_g12::TRINITY_DN15020_c7_g12_i1::g.124646::m.124646
MSGEWKELTDPNTKRNYFFHTGTKESSWTRPKELGPAPSVGGWKEVIDPRTGRKYYSNVDTGESTWTKPDGFIDSATGPIVVDLEAAQLYAAQRAMREVPPASKGKTPLPVFNPSDPIWTHDQRSASDNDSRNVPRSMAFITPATSGHDPVVSAIVRHNIGADAQAMSQLIVASSEQEGTVAKWDEEKRNGVISGPRGEDIYVYGREIRGHSLKPNHKVRVQVYYADKIAYAAKVAGEGLVSEKDAREEAEKKRQELLEAAQSTTLPPGQKHHPCDKCGTVLVVGIMQPIVRCGVCQSVVNIPSGQPAAPAGGGAPTPVVPPPVQQTPPGEPQGVSGEGQPPPPPAPGGRGGLAPPGQPPVPPPAAEKTAAQKQQEFEAELARREEERKAAEAIAEKQPGKHSIVAYTTAKPTEANPGAREAPEMEIDKRERLYTGPTKAGILPAPPLARRAEQEAQAKAEQEAQQKAAAAAAAKAQAEALAKAQADAEAKAKAEAEAKAKAEADAKAKKEEKKDKKDRDRDRDRDRDGKRKRKDSDSDSGRDRRRRRRRDSSSGDRRKKDKKDKKDKKRR